MKKLFGILLAVSFLALGTQAQARSLVSTLALAPDAIFHVVTVGTDTAEYVTAKVAQGVAKVDAVADAAVDFFHGIAHPAATVTTTQKLAKQQAKLAAKAKKTPQTTALLAKQPN